MKNLVLAVLFVLGITPAAFSLTLQCNATKTSAAIEDIGVKPGAIDTVARESFAIDLDPQSPDMQIKKAELPSMDSRVTVSYASNVNGAALSTVELDVLDNYGEVAKESVKAKSSFESQDAAQLSFTLQSLWNEKQNQNSIVVSCRVQ